MPYFFESEGDNSSAKEDIEQSADSSRIKQRKNGLLGVPSSELAEGMKVGWEAPQEISIIRPIAQIDHVAKRRSLVSARFPGECIIIPAGKRKMRSGDVSYRFRAATEYAYLTGDQTHGGILLLEPAEGGGHECTLFLRSRSNRSSGEFWLDGEAGELWVGRRRSLSENETMLGISCRDSREAVDRIREITAPIRLVVGHDEELEALVSARLAPARNEELTAFLDELRLVKDDFEIGELQKAVDSTIRGFRDVVETLHNAEETSERYVEGTFFRRARVEGNDVGYNSICAAGANACTLHWSTNDGLVRPGEMILLDAGVETHTLYTADITRTFPISGSYTEVQRRVYNAVYDAQEASMAVIRPGAAYRDMHDAAQRVLADRLVKWGILSGPVEEIVTLGLQRRWTLHGTGHMLGMDLHDCAESRTTEYVDGTLKAGMCLTVEPGLYFQPDDLTVPKEYRGIGVRIEDDILVTANGMRILSAALPRQAEDVEAWMKASK